jgi:hypothetical protein
MVRLPKRKLRFLVPMRQAQEGAVFRLDPGDLPLKSLGM